MLPWGDSSKLKVAEWVLAIGNPFQLNQTVTLGIVSAPGPQPRGPLATYEDFIQTDAAINPGNSGGALVNARGELIGINTAIFSETGGYQGIGFAVPSNLARHVMDDLIKYGEVQRGTIPGITVAAADDADGRAARRAEHARRAGRQMHAATPTPTPPACGRATSSSASTGHRSTIASQFERLLSDAKIGSTVTLGVLRERKQVTVKVPIVKATAPRRRG